MTQIGMIYMIYCDASLWEILFWLSDKLWCRGGSRTAPFFFSEDILILKTGMSARLGKNINHVNHVNHVNLRDY